VVKPFDFVNLYSKRLATTSLGQQLTQLQVGTSRFPPPFYVGPRRAVNSFLLNRPLRAGVDNTRAIPCDIKATVTVLKPVEENWVDAERAIRLGERKGRKIGVRDLLVAQSRKPTWTPQLFSSEPEG
jgi:hypothetical protein